MCGDGLDMQLFQQREVQVIQILFESVDASLVGFLFLLHLLHCARLLLVNSLFLLHLFSNLFHVVLENEAVLQFDAIGIAN